jgi:hypothetical protein
MPHLASAKDAAGSKMPDGYPQQSYPMNPMSMPGHQNGGGMHGQMKMGGQPGNSMQRPGMQKPNMPNKPVKKPSPGDKKSSLVKSPSTKKQKEIIYSKILVV